jgi:acetylornithine deacetylase/succinyl-diaminopimelate desuccinylase-like protein
MTGVKKQYEDLLHGIDETEVVRLCSELVRFHSVNPPGDELAIAQFAADHVREAGLTVEMVPRTVDQRAAD